MEKRKRKELNLKEKVDLINLSNGKSQRQLAEIFGIGKTQVQTILKRKADILEGYANDASQQRKRLCKRSPVEEINILMWNWFQKARSQGITISGPMLQEKALLYAKELQISESDFKASNGWLGRFKARHNINLHTVCGESESVCQETVDEWLHKLPEIIKGYCPADIYNMDETGLFFRSLPDKTLAIKGEDCKGGKKSKDRLTVMLCVNMEGKFEKPLVIGKAARPRCFRNLNTNSLPVDWRFNRKAWMNSSLFIDWIKLFDRKMKHAGRHVLLLLDNAPSHPQDLKLDNVRTVFLPANTTSRLQPLDQGIINHMKQIYRKRLLRSVISKIDESENVSVDIVSKSVSVLDAVNWISASVKEIKPEIVTKCFRKCGVVISDAAGAENDADDDDIPIMELVEMMRVARERISIEQEMSAEEYINMDCDIPANEGLSENWESELIECVRAEGNQSEDTVDDEVDDPVEPLLINSHQEALKWISQLKMYCLNKDLADIIPSFDFAQEQLEKLSVKSKCDSQQTTLDRFFK